MKIELYYKNNFGHDLSDFADYLSKEYDVTLIEDWDVNVAILEVRDRPKPVSLDRAKNQTKREPLIEE